MLFFLKFSLYRNEQVHRRNLCLSRERLKVPTFAGARMDIEAMGFYAKANI